MSMLKFRAWDTNLKDPMMYEDWRQLWGDEADGLILMQYTGLRDKNGKEIYEGDIVIRDYVYGEGYGHKGERIPVAYEEDDAIFYPLQDCDKGQKIEVTGNVYENPELLEPK